MGIVQAFVVLSALAASPALAQQTSPEQVSAIRSNCRSDFMSKCSGVTPGGADAIACLRKNVAQLSSSCQTAVNAIAPKPSAPAPSPAAAPPPAAAPTAAPARAAAAPTPTPPAAPVASAAAVPPAATTPAAPARMIVPSADQVVAIRASCPTDFSAHCAGVPAGGMEGLACLQRNAAKLSAPCRFAVNTGAAPAPAAVAAPPAAAAAAPAAAPVRTAARTPAPVAAAAVSPPTADQQAAIRASCRSDFMARCSGVTPGGADALACLKRNAAQLSPACRTAVSAIGAPSTAAAAPAASPAMPTAAQQAAIKNTCRRDFMTNCRGVQPGGPDAFACLQRNSARLSPDCKTSLAAVADPAAAPAATAAAAPAAKPARPVLFPIRRAIRERMMGN